MAPIWVEPDGSNRIIIVPGANDGLLPEHGAAAVAAQERVDAVIGQFEIDQAVTTAAFRAARDRGAITILNPAPGRGHRRRTWPRSATGSSPTRPSSPSSRAPRACRTTSTTRRAGARGGGRSVPGSLVTLGERGAALVGRGRRRAASIPAPSVEAVDTTGAGDAFVGAFAFGLASGWDEVDAVRLGCAIAAESVLPSGDAGLVPRPRSAAEAIVAACATAA